MKKGGTKRKIPIERRETKEQRSVTCNKRRKTIFSKSADLCRLSGANIAVFVTSPAENSDVVYSFSGYSPAHEIADCYFNGKPPPTKINPQAKLGFLWEDPNLYRNCHDLSELNVIEDRLERLKKDIMECLEKQEKSQLGSSVDQIYGNASSSSSTVDQVHSETSSSQVNQNPSSFVGSSFSDQSYGTGLWETKEENSSIMRLTQETQTEPMVNVEDESFWTDFINEEVLGLNSNFRLDEDKNPQDTFEDSSTFVTSQLGSFY